MDMLDERGPGPYTPNDLARLLSKPEYVGGIIRCFDITQLSFSQMPKYLRNTKFQNPENALDGPFQYANKCGSAFEWLTDRPDNFQAFTDMYTLFAYTEIPDVVNAAKSLGVGKESGNGSRIELQEHDFFTPQPIKGARAYFMRSVLHDRPDEQCRVILGHVKDVMEPGYSKILINDCIVADEGAAWQHVALDMFMMAQLSARERTEREWRELIESCGLKIAGIYNEGQGNEGLIEVVSM
ncbi:hypothetical protein KJ359_008364 [Pestalotiopsis sp. 9143b]|nr:hypothetical protein KJ359_008364 [Pestalotiopsis sp. 9143b]